MANAWRYRLAGPGLFSPGDGTTAAGQSVAVRADQVLLVMGTAGGWVAWMLISRVKASNALALEESFQRLSGHLHEQWEALIF